jgi:hypothetical protein
MRSVTNIQKRKWLVQDLQGTIDCSVEPGMVSTRSEGDQIMLVSDVFLLGVMQWVVVGDIVLDAAILLVRWAIDCQQLLRRLEDGSFAQNQ